MEMLLSVKNQSIETSGITKDYKEALCEFIWNALEANATEIHINYTINEYKGLDTVSIIDNGYGINFNNLSETFGAFLASEKNTSSFRIKSKANKGKGRFSFISFATLAEWNTIYKDKNNLKKYMITLSNENKEKIDYTPAEDVASGTTGTSVTFYNIHDLDPSELAFEKIEDHFLYEFAWYLYLNKQKNIKIYVAEKELDYNNYVDTSLSDTIVKVIDNFSFEICLIVWNQKIKEKFRSYYFDSNDTIKGIDTTTFNRNTVNFSHSVFIKSSYFDNRETVSLFDYVTGINLFDSEKDQLILKTLKREIQNFISTKIKIFMSAKADKEVNKMISERKTFPKFSDDAYDQLRKKDLINVTKELYTLEPRIFYKLKDVQEKSLLAFLNLLLSSEERENILTVIDEIVKLDSEQRKEFADILKKTKLENIINTIRFIEGRYRVIEILKTIIYDLDKFTNERDHIQKIIENNYWIFGEQYNLASADRTMHYSLSRYNYLLYGAKSETEKLPEEIDAERRMDIFLCSSRKVETSFETTLEENIVVELKAPKIVLSKNVYRQIEDYMEYIRSHPQFNSYLRRWKFIAVCKTVDDYIKNLYASFEDKGKPGLIHKSNNYEIYAMTWDDIFNSFELRHSFLLDKLNYDRQSIIDELGSKDKKRETVDALTKMTFPK